MLHLGDKNPTVMNPDTRFRIGAAILFNRILLAPLAKQLARMCSAKFGLFRFSETC